MGYFTAILLLIDCKVLLCDFHREQACERWLNTTYNGMRTHKGVLLAYLRRIALSRTEELYFQNVDDLVNSDVWGLNQAHKLRDWLNKTWLPAHKVL